MGGGGGKKRCFIRNLKMVNKLSVEDEKLAILFYAHRIFDSVIVITILYIYIASFADINWHFQNEHSYIEIRRDYCERLETYICMTFVIIKYSCNEYFTQRYILVLS